MTPERRLSRLRGKLVFMSSGSSSLEPTTVTVLENADYWTVEVIEQPEGDWIVTNFHGVRAEERAWEYARFLAVKYGVTAATHP